MQRTVDDFEFSFEITRLFDEPLRTKEMIKLRRRMEQRWQDTSTRPAETSPRVGELYERVCATI